MSGTLPHIQDDLIDEPYPPLPPITPITQHYPTLPNITPYFPTLPLITPHYPTEMDDNGDGMLDNEELAVLFDSLNIACADDDIKVKFSFTLPSIRTLTLI